MLLEAAMMIVRFCFLDIICFVLLASPNRCQGHLENLWDRPSVCTRCMCWPLRLTYMSQTYRQNLSCIPGFIRPYFVWRTVFSVCVVPDRRPSLKRDQFYPSRTTTSSPHTVYFQESRVSLQHPLVNYYNVALRRLRSNSAALNFPLFWRHYNDVLDGGCIVTMLPASPDTFVSKVK